MNTPDPIMNQEMTPEISIRSDLKPGDVGYITYLHGLLYAEEHGWDYHFEAYVAGPLAEFARSRSTRQKIWIAECAGTIVGSVAIVEHSPTEAQLRWLLVHPSTRGQGLGRKLMNEAIQFARDAGYAFIFLWTVSELTEAAALYASCGFKKTSAKTHEIWGKVLTEERYDLKISSV